MCFTFLAAQGHGVGSSLLEADQVDTCRRLLAEAGDRIVLPVDVVCADGVRRRRRDERRRRPTRSRTTAWASTSARAPSRCSVPSSATRRTVFWNGPMGVFELAPFQEGTRGVARPRSAAVDGLSVVGGGDSAAAVRQLGLDEDAYGHISTGGGASLEYLEGRELPGLAVLAD